MGPAPGHPGYWPEAPREHLTVAHLHAYEPRDATWADAVDPALTAQLEADLRVAAPAVKEIKVHCRTSVCAVRLTPSAAARSGGTFTASLYNLHQSETRGPGDVYLLLRTSMAMDAAGTMTRLRARRATGLFNLRTGRLPLPEGLTAARIPRE
jgi:hypothetical protein